jgi:hypothetical protein
MQSHTARAAQVPATSQNVRFSFESVQCNSIQVGSVSSKRVQDPRLI